MIWRSRRSKRAAGPSRCRESCGYGFIQTEDGHDVFVHFSAIKGENYRTLNEGQKVEFSVAEGNKGLQAEDVEKVEE